MGEGRALCLLQGTILAITQITVSMIILSKQTNKNTSPPKLIPECIILHLPDLDRPLYCLNHC